MSNRPPMRTVTLAESTVTMASVDELRAEVRGLQQEAETLAAAAEKLRADAVARFVEAGLILVGRPNEWSEGHPEAAIPMANAMRLIQAIDDDNGETEGAKKSGLGGLFGRKKAPAGTPAERRYRDERSSQLRVMLAELGRAFGTSLPAVTQVHGKAIYMDDRAVATQAEADELLERARALQHEADQREVATRDMGLDALFTAAQLRVSEPPLVKSPLDLRGGERAYLAERADLARQKTVASTGAGTQGLTFPTTQTGILYIVGSYRAQSVKTEALARLGSGIFVVTNQRLGFIGDLKSFSFPLSGLRHAVQYNDGLLLMREGRENGDVLLTASAGLVLFYINYVLQLQGA
ncbi:MAG TPA: hypothetical protein VGR61_01475 [Candidatus Dormibacteraeota bacterium]|nr:hypothetical protein [Candidatus Dormibacteraeota bacterium]